MPLHLLQQDSLPLEAGLALHVLFVPNLRNRFGEIGRFLIHNSNLVVRIFLPILFQKRDALLQCTQSPLQRFVFFPQLRPDAFLHLVDLGSRQLVQSGRCVHPAFRFGGQSVLQSAHLNLDVGNVIILALFANLVAFSDDFFKILVFGIDKGCRFWFIWRRPRGKTGGMLGRRSALGIVFAQSIVVVHCCVSIDLCLSQLRFFHSGFLFHSFIVVVVFYGAFRFFVVRKKVIVRPLGLCFFRHAVFETR
mmetsp:Transcript_6190/g.15028  ORF Transcript_6190/g.15028 Transcript_6190/m.15028 type:complete len:249 (+) Transcript_6190:1723-2469(+)